MKTKQFLLRVSGIIVLFTIGFLLLITSCKKDEPNEPPTANVELIGSATIGADGGTINAGDLVVVIPESTFSGSKEILIYKSDEETEFGSQSVSGLFYIKGLPDTYAKPLRICIKYTGQLDNNSYISFGEYDYCHSPVDTIIVNRMLDAVDSAGYLVSYLDPIMGKKATLPRYQGKWGFPVSGVSNYYTYTTSHFKISFPYQNSAIQSIEELGDGLEGAYDSLSSWGFRNSRTVFPIEVTVKSLEPGTYGNGGRVGLKTVNDGVIQINTSNIGNNELCRVNGAHEYFHLVMGYYSESHNYDWVQEACAVWIESFFANNPATYVSKTRSAREGAPFDGLQKGIEKEGADEHGYGLSSVMKYVEKNWGIDAIRMTWEEYAQSQTPCNGLRQQTAMYTEWWGDFLKEYFMGNIYPDMGPSWANANSRTTFRTAADTSFTFKKSYPDLSGYIYKVEFEYSGYTDNSALQLTLSGTGGGIYVFSLVGSNLTLLGNSRTSFTVNGLKALQANHGMIYVVIYNDNTTPPNYLAMTDLTLTGRVTNAVPLNFTKVYVKVRCLTTETWVCPGSTYDKDDNFSLSTHLLTGNFNGNVFTGNYSDQNYTEHITITVDPVKNIVTDMNLTYLLVQTTGDYVDKTATCSNIPYLSTGINTYYVYGLETCNSIDELTLDATFQGCTRTLKNHWCTSDGGDNLIEIKFQ